MPDIGTVTEVINASEVRLYLTNNTNQFITLQELTLVVNREEFRDDIDGGAAYFYGQHDNTFEATLFLTGPDFGTYLNRTQFVSDALPASIFLLEYTQKDGVSQTVTVTALTPHQEFLKQPRGGVKTIQRFRINEEVSSTDVS